MELCIGVQAHSVLGTVGGGGLILIVESVVWVLFKRTQIAVKTKTLTILTSNETVSFQR